MNQNNENKNSAYKIQLKIMDRNVRRFVLITDTMLWIKFKSPKNSQF